MSGGQEFLSSRTGVSIYPRNLFQAPCPSTILFVLCLSSETCKNPSVSNDFLASLTALKCDLTDLCPNFLTPRTFILCWLCSVIFNLQWSVSSLEFWPISVSAPAWVTLPVCILCHHQILLLLFWQKKQNILISTLFLSNKYLTNIVRAYLMKAFSTPTLIFLPLPSAISLSWFKWFSAQFSVLPTH